MFNVRHSRQPNIISTGMREVKSITIIYFLSWYKHGDITRNLVKDVEEQPSVLQL